MLIKTGVQWGVHYPGGGFESKENKITIMKTKRMGAVLVGEPPNTDPQMCILFQTSSWTSRGCVEDVLLPTELIRTERSTEGVSRWGLQFAKLE